MVKQRSRQFQRTTERQRQHQQQRRPFQRDQSRFNKEERHESSALIFGGVRTVAEALRNEKIVITQLFSTEQVSNRFELAELFEQAAERMIPLQKITAEQLSRLVGSEQHQGIACKVKSLPMMELEELIAAPQKPNLVALDQVQDPMNLGAILRSANAFGIGAIICPKDHSAPLREAAIKASAGAALHTPVIYVTNLARAMEELKDAGYWIVAMMAPETSEEVGEHGWAKGAAIHHHRLQKSGPLPLSQLTPATPWVLLAGSEGKGIRPLVARGADYKAFIPMNQGQAVVESLNVSAACAVALYALSQSTAMDD